MDAPVFASDIAFTPTVKAIQSRKGSRAAYARMEQSGSWETSLTPDLREFIEGQTSVFLATANADGQPYIQHRGGPPGFLHVLDDRNIGFVDFAGNRQFITLGNLQENPKVHLFLMDYAHRQRIKIWGEARVVENDPELTARLMPKDYRARAAQVIVLRVVAWDANCRQHIPQLLDAGEVARAIAARDERIAALELQIQRMKSPQ
ncbi:MAG: pyridoxamine 5'-phosphate oxidase family protein [Gammaproteobacteria bacterium]